MVGNPNKDCCSYRSEIKSCDNGKYMGELDDKFFFSCQVMMNLGIKSSKLTSTSFVHFTKKVHDWGG
jgi:hypothetical protein